MLTAVDAYASANHVGIVPDNSSLKLCSSKRYWNDPKQTDSVMRRYPDDPETLWMHTGDQVIMDEEGYLQGGVSSLIVRGYPVLTA